MCKLLNKSSLHNPHYKMDMLWDAILCMFVYYVYEKKHPILFHTFTQSLTSLSIFRWAELPGMRVLSCGCH